MIHDIFSRTKIKKKSKIQKPDIIADIHEKNSLVLAELQSSEQINLEIKSLKIGDYLIGDTIIERKTTNDFISSMLSKRLIEQLRNMQKYKQKILIIEGKQENLINNETNLNPNSIRGFILSIINNYNTGIIFTKDYKDTAQYLITLAKQQLKPKTEISLHSRIPKTIKEQKQYILEAFPNIGPKTAKNLIKEFKTLSNIFNLPEEELKKILKGKTENFKKLIRE